MPGSLSEQGVHKDPPATITSTVYAVPHGQKTHIQLALTAKITEVTADVAVIPWK